MGAEVASGGNRSKGSTGVEIEVEVEIGEEAGAEEAVAGVAVASTLLEPELPVPKVDDPGVFRTQLDADPPELVPGFARGDTVRGETGVQEKEEEVEGVEGVGGVASGCFSSRTEEGCDGGDVEAEVEVEEGDGDKETEY